MRGWSGNILAGAAFIFWLAAPSVASARQPSASIVVDANSGAILHAHAPDASRYPASLTKMMTLYLVFEQLKRGRLKMSSRIKFSARAAGQPPSKLPIKAGGTLTVEQAIKALITKSANDVATAVAEHISGNEPAFARLMTARARNLGMRATTFRNASGLPDDAQVTTARDMATLGIALQNDFPDHYSLFSLRSFLYGGKRYRNHNRLLGRFKGTDGIKTGYTRASGFNLTTSVRRGGKHVVGVVIGQRSGRVRNALMRRLLAKALPEATTRRTRPVARPVARQPLLVARPRIVPRPALARQPLRPMSIGRQTLAMQARRAPQPRLEPTTARAPSTFASQLARLSASIPADRRVRVAAPPQIRRSSDRAARRRPARRRVVAAPRAATHHVQIGAFFSRSEAEQALEATRLRAGQILQGYQPIYVKVDANSRALYRARFAGFDRAGADQACMKLKSIRLDCFVTRVN